MMRTLLVTAGLAIAAVSAVEATPIRIPVDQSQSSVSVTLCVAGKCDTETSPVSGEAWIKLDSYSSAPASLTIYDFTFSLVNNLNFSLSWGILGSLTATASNVAIHYDTPFIPQPSTPVVGGAYTAPNVPTNTTGNVAYQAVGIPCAVLQAAGMPCADTKNLADQGTQTSDINGAVTVSAGRVVTFVSQPNISGPLDPNNPDLGSLTLSGTIRGSVTVPLRGDANLDGLIDGRDVQPFLNVCLSPVAFNWQQRFAVDMNDDDVFTLADVPLFVTTLLNGG